MSARLVSNASVNRLATFAKAMAVRGSQAFTAEGLAWALWRANALTVREHYGERTDEMFSEIGRMARDFRYAPAYGSALQLVRDFRDLMSNSMLHDDAQQSDSWRVLVRLNAWLSLYVCLEQVEKDRLPLSKRDARTLRLLSMPRGSPRLEIALPPDDQLSLF